MASSFRCCLIASLMVTLCLIQPTYEQNIFAPFLCAGKIVSAINTCQQRLVERLEMIDKAGKQVGEEIDKSVFACCYFAEFSHCLDSKTEGKCGSEISTGIARGANSIVQSLDSQCEDYTYYSPTCLFVNYLNFIIAFGIILVLIGVISCVIDCLRR